MSAADVLLLYVIPGLSGPAGLAAGVWLANWRHRRRLSRLERGDDW